VLRTSPDDILRTAPDRTTSAHRAYCLAEPCPAGAKRRMGAPGTEPRGTANRLCARDRQSATGTLPGPRSRPCRDPSSGPCSYQRVTVSATECHNVEMGLGSSSRSPRPVRYSDCRGFEDVVGFRQLCRGVLRGFPRASVESRVVVRPSGPGSALSRLRKAAVGPPRLSRSHVRRAEKAPHAHAREGRTFRSNQGPPTL
jgi:hypothetical protein